MRRVRRDEIVDYVTYEETRAQFREKMMGIKAARRVHVPPVMTFLFETTDTVRYQIQEMMRVERIVREADINHEIETYNDLIGGPDELGCTLLIEIENPAERAEKLRDWRTLPEHIYLKLEDGTRVGATYDPRQVGDDRLSSVQYLKFPVGGRTPVALGVDHEKMRAEVELSPEVRSALAADLREP